MDDPIVILPRLHIPAAELRFRTSRSGGPGGQHVNTSSTRVELLFDVQRSSALSTLQRARLLEVLANRIGQDGVLRLVAQTERSQSANRAAAVARFAALLAAALRPRRKRRATRPTAASRQRRQAEKTRRATRKRERRLTSGDLE